METPGSVPSTQAAQVTSAPDSPETGAAAAVPGPVWRFLISPRWLGWHLFAVVAFWGCCWLGDWQFHRAIGGNALSWAYTFEWPLFAVLGAVFWARTVRDEFRTRRGLDLRTGKPLAEVAASGGPVLPDGLGTQPIERPADDADEAERASYDAYLARLSAEVRGHNKWLRATSG